MIGCLRAVVLVYYDLNNNLEGASQSSLGVHIFCSRERLNVNWADDVTYNKATELGDSENIGLFDARDDYNKPGEVYLVHRILE